MLGGLPTWLVARGLFFRMRGSETGMVTVDERGVIHVLSGRSAVRRLQGLYDVGAERWLGHSVIGGLLVGVGLCALPAIVAVVFDAPWVVALFATGGVFVCLNMVGAFGMWLVWPQLMRQTRLDGAVMLPALALYARHHGWRAAVTGVPADQFAATLAMHPDDVRIAGEYSDGAAALARVASWFS